jgi:hypothetical protein
MTFNVSCKHACFDTQNIHVGFTHLYRTAPQKSLIEAPQPQNIRKIYHQP